MDAGIIAVIVVAAAGVAGIWILAARHNRKRWMKRLAALNEDQEYELVDLWKHRFVLPKGRRCSPPPPTRW
jgi:hypothetical protein